MSYIGSRFGVGDADALTVLQVVTGEFFAASRLGTKGECLSVGTAPKRPFGTLQYSSAISAASKMSP